MNNKLVTAVPLALVALAAIVLSFRYLDTSALVATYLCVLGVGVVATLDYRLNWKRILALR